MKNFCTKFLENENDVIIILPIDSIDINDNVFNIKTTQSVDHFVSLIKKFLAT